MLRLRSKSYAPSLLMVMLCLGAWLTSLALLRPDVSPCRDALCPCCPETVAHSSKASVLLSILFYFSKKSGSIHFRSTILYVRKRKKNLYYSDSFLFWGSLQILFFLWQFHCSIFLNTLLFIKTFYTIVGINPVQSIFKLPFYIEIFCRFIQIHYFILILLFWGSLQFYFSSVPVLFFQHCII